MNSVAAVLVLGVGATVVTDVWGVIRKQALGLPAPNYALVGRWFGHMAEGRFRHVSIAAATKVPGEAVIGWTMHYLIGIAFAAVLVLVWGEAWLMNPALIPALLVGTGSVVAPFLLMQPGMGAGIASLKTARPLHAQIQSVLTHTVFGLGLYVTGLAIHVLLM